MLVQLESSEILLTIQAGMSVYDLTGCALGKVIRVYDKSNSQQPLVGRAPITQYLERVPHEVASRLRQSGYVVVDSGLLSGDYFILPHQIADVTDQGIFLHFRQNRLIQL